MMLHSNMKQDSWKMCVNNRTFEAAKKKNISQWGCQNYLSPINLWVTQNTTKQQKNATTWWSFMYYMLSVFFCSHIQPPELKIEVNIAKVEVPPGAT